MTGRTLLAGAAVLFALATAASAQFEGFWDTNQGAMRIAQDGDRAHGDYDLKGGRIHGDIDGDGLSGIWAQDWSNRRCYEERMGSFYWGRFRLHISDNDEYFHGRWSYCDQESGSGGEWTGHRVHHHHWHNWDHY